MWFGLTHHRQQARFPALLASCMLLAALPAAAQLGSERSLRPGEVNGLVSFQGGVGTPGSVVVYLETEIGNVVQQTTLVGNARFRFEGLERTRYVLRAKAPGYLDATNRVDLTMMPTQSVMLTLRADNSGSTGAPAGVGSTQPMVAVGALLAPESAQKELAEGEQAMTRNALPEATAHFKKAIQIYPEYYQAHHSLGTLYMDQRNWPEAEKALKRSVEINDKYAPSCIALGALYNIQGKPADALPLLKRGVELEPQAWQAHFELAQALLLANKAADAEPHLWRVHELEPKVPLAHFLLGKLGLSRGDSKIARQEFQHFLDLDPTSPLAAPVRAKIEQIDKALAAKQ